MSTLVAEVEVAKIVAIYPTGPVPVVVRETVATLVAAAEQGPEGPPGPPSAALDFEFVQASPATPWTVNHNLGVEPIITVLTAGGVEVDAEIVHVSDNQAMIYFKSPFAGRARCV